MKHAFSRRVVAMLALLAAVNTPVLAGGPLFVMDDGQPFRWDQAQPVRYVVDVGPLGRRSHAEGVAIVARAFRAWTDVPTARLRVEAGGELPRDIRGGSIIAFLGELSEDQPSPLLFDSDGSILDTLLGQGASQAILGIGFPMRVDGPNSRIRQGFAVLNGRLYDRFSDNYVLGSCTHELGHFLSLAHSQLDAELRLDGDPSNDHLSPVMFYRGPNDPASLHRDDHAWFSWLYPGSDFASSTGTIRGRVLLPDRVTGLQGVQVIARRVGDPQMTAVSATSGFLFRGVAGGLGDLRRLGSPNNPGVVGGATDAARLGEFLIPGLPPGSYILEVQGLDPFPGVPVPAAYLIGGPKFWREGSSGQDEPSASTAITVSAGQEAAGIDLMVNGDHLGEPLEVAETEPNELSAPQVVTLPGVIQGVVEDGVTVTGDRPVKRLQDLEDVYEVELPGWTTVTAHLSAAQPKADLDLYVLSEGRNKPELVAASLEPGAAGETVQIRLGPGRHYFGVQRAGQQGSAYTLRLLATPAPEPDQKPAPAFITYLILGDINETTATARWQTTLEVPSVAYYHQPQREVGSPTRRQDHSLALTELAPSTRTGVEVYASSTGRLDIVGGLDIVMAPLTTATAAAPEGAPRITTGSSATPLGGPLFAQVAVRLTNQGKAEALKVSITEVELAPGWELLSEVAFGAGLPDTLEVGRIGAGGAAAFVVRLARRSGNAAPKVTIHGTYTDAAGTELSF